MIVLLLSVTFLEPRNQTGKTHVENQWKCRHDLDTHLYRNSHLIRAQKFNDDISICSHERNSAGHF
jgi:hypothetical protein